ncbi:hypothetical protein Pfo_003422 [Paulownia fortunei]|nr:hypothetical protein Pfo_003422 [Paulownia fortunei]
MSSKEAMDLGGSRRRGSAPKAGSVWESRMKLDEVKGGIKVFIATNENSEENTQNICSSTSSTSTVNKTEVQMDKKLNDVRPKQSPVGVSGKRKTWKSESSEGSPVQIARQRSELSKNLDEQCKELSVSADGIKKSPVPIKKTRSVSSQKGTTADQSSDGNEKNAIQSRKVKSDSTEVTNDGKSEGNSELRKVKSEPSKNLDESCDGNLKNSNSLQLVKAKTVVQRKVIYENIKNSDDKKVVDESNKDLEGSIGRIDKSPVGVKKSRSDEDCKEFGVCEEKAITSNVGQIKTAPSDDDFVDGDEEEQEEEEEDKEIEVEKKSLDIKEITVQEQKTKKIVIEEKKVRQSNERPVPISPIVKKQPPPAVNHARFHPSPTKTKPSSDHFHGIPRTNSRLQSFVDLVMWRDVSKSAFVFGIGTFAIISSSYTKDLNISFISVLSYLGLVYLAAIFLFRSLISRGSMEMDDSNQDCVVGEEEAIWVVKLVLPYVNEFLLKLRALFSGDPATTMKLAVLLFILARCGSSITIWKMARLGFIGVFTVPKVCSTYSSQLTAYGTFWIRRFGDAWESCSHKKAVGFAIFTLVWNLSSVVARIWAVFMLFAAFKYYQQSLITEGWANEEATSTENSSWQEQSIGGQRSGRRSTLAEMRKQKKVC